MTACGLLGMLMTRTVLGLLTEVSRDSTTRTNMIGKQENNFWTDCEKRYSFINTFE